MILTVSVKIQPRKEEEEEDDDCDDKKPRLQMCALCVSECLCVYTAIYIFLDVSHVFCSI